jgi:multidrug efflux pump subunit AcrA (membrane-fusion protein)
MSLYRRLVGFLPSLVLGLAIAAGVITRDRWIGRLLPERAQPSADRPKDTVGQDHDHDREHVALSDEARANLKLVIGRAEVRPFWKTLSIPGRVVEKPATHRTIPAPMAGVVQAIHVRPGEALRGGELLFELRIVSEAILTAQGELFRSARELQMVGEQRARLDQARGAGVSESRIIDLDMQLNRLRTAVQTHRQDLTTHGLTDAQIADAEAGRFATRSTIVFPPVSGIANGMPEVESIAVRLGEQVTAGQPLGSVADFRQLALEGRAFRTDAGLLARALGEGMPVTAEFPGDDPTAWPSPIPPLAISRVANTIDPATRTLTVVIDLDNQARAYVRNGKTAQFWRFRPGQTAQVHVPVEKIDGGIVVPAAAVARDGPEAFVFVKEGKEFAREPVELLHYDRNTAVIKPNDHVKPGAEMAMNAAAGINRVFKAQQSGGAGHGHDHDH